MTWRRGHVQDSLVLDCQAVVNISYNKSMLFVPLISDGFVFHSSITKCVFSSLHIRVLAKQNALCLEVFLKVTQLSGVHHVGLRIGLFLSLNW